MLGGLSLLPQLRLLGWVAGVSGEGRPAGLMRGNYDRVEHAMWNPSPWLRQSARLAHTTLS